MRGRHRLPWLGLLVVIVSLLLPLAPASAMAQDGTADAPPVADADGVPDADDQTPNGESDTDDIPDESDNCPTADNPDQVDSDGDLIGDACDETPFPVVDSDGDGIPDDQDLTPNGESDADDVPDDVDNCVAVDNADQADSDGDAIGDACDETPLPVVDSDGDGTPDAADPTPNGELDADDIPDDQDNCPEVDNTEQVDSDGDGTGDACDDTPEGDGVSAAGANEGGFGTLALDDVEFDKAVTHLNGEPLVFTTLDAVPGDVITYTFTITNTSTRALDFMEITDEMLGGTITSCPSALAAGQTTTCTATYTLTPADVDEGFVLNFANLRALRSNPSESVLVSDSEFTLIIQETGLALTKSAGPEVDGVIAYTYTVTNTGNVTLANVSITDDRIPSAAIDCDPNTAGVQSTIAAFAWDASVTCTATYTVTRPDRQVGSVTNTATANGAFDGEAIVSAAASQTVTVEREFPQLTLTKEASAPANPALNDTISYTLTATNTGNVPLIAVTITDPSLTDLDCERPLPVNLAVDETVTCTGTHTIGQTDVDRGKVVNVAYATGVSDAGIVISPLVSKTVTIAQHPGLALTKAVVTLNDQPVDGPVTDADLGDVVGYELVATNTGNVTLTGVSIADPLNGLSALTCDPAAPATLAPGATLTCTATYTIEQDDVDAGAVTNTANASATFGSTPVNAAPASVTVTIPQHPSLALTKEATARNGTSVTGDITDADLGDVITYTLVASNSGNVTLTGVTIADGLDGASTPVCNQAAPVTLAPTATLTCTVTSTIDQGDADAGSVVNTASASALFGATTVSAPDASETVTILQNPALSLTKQVTRDGTPVTTAKYGEVLTYTMTAINTGNVTLTGVTVSDPLAGLSVLSCNQSSPVSLAASESVTCTATYTVGLADEQRRQVENTSTASGTFGSETVSADPATVTVQVARPTILELLLRVLSQLRDLFPRP
jgi:uncharacterized repeat protein (TIGR01451 family)